LRSEKNKIYTFILSAINISIKKKGPSLQTTLATEVHLAEGKFSLEEQTLNKAKFQRI
jgi:hypothetical protein